MEHLWSLSNMTRVHVDSGLPYTTRRSFCYWRKPTTGFKIFVKTRGVGPRPKGMVTYWKNFPSHLKQKNFLCAGFSATEKYASFKST